MKRWTDGRATTRAIAAERERRRAIYGTDRKVRNARGRPLPIRFEQPTNPLPAFTGWAAILDDILAGILKGRH